MALHAVIPAGGAGTRLWPMSRRSRPKHVLALSRGGRSLLRETYERIAPLADQVHVLTEARQMPLVKRLVPELGREAFIVEPAARGTTSALGLAALTLLARDPDAVMLSVAADHVVRGARAFGTAIRRAVAAAGATDCLVTIGLRPRFAATGYGYVRVGERTGPGRAALFRVAEFVEKPDAARAAEYLAAGTYYWNLSMFCWRAAAFVMELDRHSPQHLRGLRRVLEARSRGDEGEALRLYSRLPAQAVDYTVMERTGNLLLVAADFGWNDVGSWAELHEIWDRDRAGNVVEGDAVLLDTRDCLLSAPGKLVAAIGLRDLIVIETDDAILICPRSRAQDVKRIVADLERSGRIRYL
ncbi:MAG: mannose-1-phosphate guanylyltransferase [Candidatus Dormibacteraceae bacterium]